MKPQDIENCKITTKRNFNHVFPPSWKFKGVFPETLKIAEVNPVFKVGEKDAK